ncbi:MAG: hypothetical protein D6685_15230 [Bacteroidetes bacterium]|nr:hypothetical protein AWN76_005755 [Rhodothermaceae bacterium RA]RMH53951.1 MAG: hypothetical protein D6685_15230 [Bacteroidota bacterium]
MPDRFRRLLPVVLVSTTALLLAGCGPNLFDRMTNWYTLSCCGVIIVILDIIALVEVSGSNRSLGDKVLWALIIIFAPVLGCILYYFFGRK